jgi:hypothetical protein
MVAWVPIVMAASAALSAVMQERANRQNQANYEDQKDYQAAAVDAQNRYNLPTAQRQRFEDAGINPYLAMSNISSGSQQSAMSAPSSPQNNPINIDPSNMINSITQYNVGDAQAALLKSQTVSQNIQNDFQEKYNQAVLKKMGAETENTVADTGIKRDYLPYNIKAQTDLFNSQRRFTDTQDFWFPSVQNWTIADLEGRVNYNNAKADESKAQKGLIESNKKMVDFDLNFKKKWQEKIVKSEISKNYADAFAATYNAKTNRMNAITSRLSVDQQANYIAVQTMESYARYGKIKLDTKQSKQMFKFVKAQAIKDIQKRQAEINNLGSNTKKTNTERSFIPFDKGFNYAEQFTRILKNAFQAGSGLGMLFGK